MKLLASVKQAAVFLVRKAAQNLNAITSSSWLNRWSIGESYSGAWQQNVTIDSQATLLAFSAVYACVTGIAADVAKLRIKLDRNVEGIWEEITANSPWLPVLRKPNHYQNRIQFIAAWIVSKLLYGNAYILKERDQRGIVVRLYVLDPNLVTVLVAEDGSVWYQLQTDYLSQVMEDLPAVPASEIIHDRMVCLWHPLIGVPPLYACGTSGTMGNRIQSNSTNFFGNKSMPGGQLTAPGAITDATAARLKAAFETNFSGTNIGKLFVAGDGLKFEAFSIPADTAQLIEQLKWTVDDVARAFHYPAWKLGGTMPPYSSGPEAVTTMYYTDCLQSLIESMELCLDEGLALPSDMGTELDLDNLMRMDTVALYEANNKMVAGGWGSPNEARFRANYKPVPGGESPLSQQQNYSLAALAKRDAQANPFVTATTPSPAPAVLPALPAPAKSMTAEDLEFLEDELKKELSFA